MRGVSVHFISELKMALNSCLESLLIAFCGEGGNAPGKPWASAGTDAISVLNEEVQTDYCAFNLNCHGDKRGYKMTTNPSLTGNFQATFHFNVFILPVPGLPRLVVIRAYSGIPSPHCGPPLSIHEGDVIELLLADLHSSWWQVLCHSSCSAFYLHICGPDGGMVGVGGFWLGVHAVSAASSV